MLDENDVIETVRMYLEAAGWTITGISNTRQTGCDLEAVNPQSTRRLCVEAKGATSADPASARYGKPFSRSQVRDHVANAFYVAARVPTEHESAIAVPRNDLHELFMRAIRPALATLEIGVLWVDEGRIVATWNWPNGRGTLGTRHPARG